MIRRVARIAAVLALLLAADRAGAHERSTSYSIWRTDQSGADVTLRIDERELTRLPAAALPSPRREQEITAAIAGGVRASRGGQPCSARDASLQADAEPGRAILRWRVECEGSGTWELGSALSELLRVPHQQFARIELAGGRIEEALLHSEHPFWQQQWEPATATETLANAFTLGLEHILGGYDHLAFVAGLLVAATTLAQVAAVVTGFTAAHSLTLALATLGWVRPSGTGIEIMIAVSIAVLAIENLLRASRAAPVRSAMMTVLVLSLPAAALAAFGDGSVAPELVAGTTLFSCCYLSLVARSAEAAKLRWLVAFSFGLLHGFGFAGALVEASFTPSNLLTTLVGFNVGVEAGQLAVVLLAWPMAAAARRRLEHRYESMVLEPASVLLLAASTFWYLTRALA